MISQKKCFKDNFCNVIFLGYVPHTYRLILYYDCESERVKITSHCKFDEGFNNLSTESVTLGFQKLIQSNHDQHILPDLTQIKFSDLDFFVDLFCQQRNHHCSH